jgi:hypothetical protein
MSALFPSMLDNFTFEGTWDFARFQDSRAFGGLEYSPEVGFTARIHGLVDYKRPEVQTGFETLRGVLAEGWHVEISDCRIGTSKSFHSGDSTLGNIEMRSHSPVTFTRFHHLNDDATWLKAAISFNALPSWLSSSPFGPAKYPMDSNDLDEWYPVSYNKAQKCFT